MADAPTLRAGRLFACERDDILHHSFDGIHVIVRCQCGCLFVSTDATVALGMIQDHVQDSGRNAP